jgi:hypothetical protein
MRPDSRRETPLPIQTLENFKRWIRHVLGIDRAVGFTVLARGWSILSGAATVLLIAHFLSPAEQGYYYTFASLVALQTVFELGFSFVILQLAAHECSRLEIDAAGVVRGDPAAHSRLASILQKSVRWYSVAAIMMAIALLVAGFHFFAAHAEHSVVHWRLPWVCVVIATILTFQMDPVFSFLEGCGFVPQVARMRLAQAMCGTTLAWGALILHHGLFAPAGVILGQALAGLTVLLSKKRLLLPLLRWNPGKHIVGWREEIWPFQWRIAVSFMSAYLIYPLFSPVLFAYRGAAEAGRMGMSLTIGNALAALAYAWINTKASPFGNMIARRQYRLLDQVFFRALLQSGAILLGGECLVLSLLLMGDNYFPRLVGRMLPLPLLAVLMLGIFLNHIVSCEAAYLRAHKREPFLQLAIVMAAMVGLNTFAAGRLWGAKGITIGYCIWGGVLYVAAATWIFRRCRKMWHGGNEGPVAPLPEAV